MRVQCILVGLVIACAPSRVGAEEQFTIDPIPGASAPYQSTVFMQLCSQNDSPTQCHTGIDITAQAGTAVVCPGNGHIVPTLNAHYTLVKASSQQDGCDVYMAMLHIDPIQGLTNVSRGAQLGPITASGGNGHLHVEMFMLLPTVVFPPDTFDLALVNPQLHAFSAVHRWNDDFVPPTLTYEYTHSTNVPPTNYSFEVNAADETSESAGFKNGLYALTLYIDGAVADHIAFDKYRDKTGYHGPVVGEYYYCTSCYPGPSSNNNPNVITYRLNASVVPGQHVWRIVCSDVKSNTYYGYVQNQLPGEYVPPTELGGRIQDGRVYLDWSVPQASLDRAAITSFDVLGTDADSTRFIVLTGAHIAADHADGAYTYALNVPTGWNGSKYQLQGNRVSGSSVILGESKILVSTAKLSVAGYPSPFRNVYTVRLGLPRADVGTVEILDVAGRMVRSLYRGDLSRGFSTWTWDGNDASGQAVAGGVYFLRASALHQAALPPIKLFRVR